MSANKLFEELKEHFNLKNKHVLIINALQARSLTAADICRITGIPRGRIYEHLNELIGYGLISKGETIPMLYSVGNLADRILEYLKNARERFNSNESAVISLLEKIEPKERIELIDTKKDFTFALLDFFSECKSLNIKKVYQIGRHNSLPFLVYPFDKAMFIKLRELVCARRPTISHTSMAYSQLIFNTYKELYKSGVVFHIIVEKEAMDYHIDLVAKDLGKEFLLGFVGNIKARVKKGQIKVSVVDEYLPMGADISKNSVLLSLIHLGFGTAINIHSRKIADVYITLFEDMLMRSESLESYFRKKKL